jgi:hypothetical protein
MRRGSWHGIKGAPFGWDAGWHGRNVNNLGDRLVEVHTERRNSLRRSGIKTVSSGASAPSENYDAVPGKQPGKQVMSPTFSSPPHGRKEVKLRPRSALTGLLVPRGKGKGRKKTAKSQRKRAEKLRRLRVEMSMRPVLAGRGHRDHAAEGGDSLRGLDNASDDGRGGGDSRHEYRGGSADGRLQIVRARSAARRPRSAVKQRVRPATATKARISKLHGGGSGRSPIGSLPVSQLGHTSGSDGGASDNTSSAGGRSGAVKNGSASINNTYSDFVRMLALFYDASDHTTIVEKACADALKLQDKMSLREYTG